MDTECVIFSGAIERNGYGRIKRNGKVHMAHRYYYEMEKGIIPDDMVIHHVCHVRSCVNTDHMEIMSREENSAIHKPDCTCSQHQPDYKRNNRTHCKKGHDLTKKEHLTSRGYCLLCHRESNNKHMRKVRAGERK